MPRTPNEGSIVKDVPSWRHYDIGMNSRTTVRRHAAVDESAETYSGGFPEGRLLDGSPPALVRCALGQPLNGAERRLRSSCSAARGILRRCIETEPRLQNAQNYALL